MYLSSTLLFLTRISTTLAVAIPLPTPSQPLRLTSRSTFQISVFEDLHFGEAEDTLWGPQQDINSTRVMNAILDAESQQLVVLNGDLITGENTFLENSTHYLDQIVAPLVRRRLPWASTYGNHDSDFNLSRAALFAREKTYPNSLTTDMLGNASAGVTNYVLPIYGSSSSSSSDTPAFLLYFLDSRGGKAFQASTTATAAAAAAAAAELPDWVDSAAVAWFSATAARLARAHARAIPSIAFMHIPVSAMLAFQTGGGGGGVDPRREPGIDDDAPLARQGAGAEDAPLLRALERARTGGLRAVFSGHDHGDSWCMGWTRRDEGAIAGTAAEEEESSSSSSSSSSPPPPPPLGLCFGQRTGYGGYGRWIRGSRQILLREGSDEVETWVRMEDGTESGRVVLNATYGVDEYPVVENRDSYGGIVR
ncbi:hypothetical protein MBLNU459_g5608t1 [Dothideomycetes sp. NU459]